MVKKINLISSLIILFLCLIVKAQKDENIEIIQYPAFAKAAGNANNNFSKMSLEKKTISKSNFHMVVQKAIKELEGSISGTCARVMKVTLQIDINGKWAIVEVGLGGTIEVEIANPNYPKRCARY